MGILARCIECEILLDLNDAEAVDDPICSDCRAVQLDYGDDDDEDNPEDEPVEQLLGPPGWGPAPMGSAKRDEPTGVQAERSEP